MIRDIVFFDLETTGIDTEEARIVQFSFIKLTEDGEQAATRLVNPGISIPQGASDVHGITDEMVREEKAFRDYAKGILKFIAGCDIAGYNIISYDIRVLHKEFERCGIDWDYSTHRFIDVSNIYRRLHPRDLSAVYRQMTGKELEGAHGAEDDTRATIEVYNELLRQHGDELSAVEDIARYSNYDREILDIGGKFVYDENGDIVFTFGKYRGEKAMEHADYLKWMIGKDFSASTKKVIKEIIRQAAQ